MASPAQSYAREALAQRRPSFFLSLAPATSTSYPQMPARRPSVAEVTTAEGTAVEGNTIEEATKAETPSRRSSSSSTTGFRVLKLGPVYWGEHADDHKEDFHDVAPASPST